MEADIRQEMVSELESQMAVTRQAYETTFEQQQRAVEDKYGANSPPLSLLSHVFFDRFVIYAVMRSESTFSAKVLLEPSANDQSLMSVFHLHWRLPR